MTLSNDKHGRAIVRSTLSYPLVKAAVLAFWSLSASFAIATPAVKGGAQIIALECGFCPLSAAVGGLSPEQYTGVLGILEAQSEIAATLTLRRVSLASAREALAETRRAASSGQLGSRAKASLDDALQAVAIAESEFELAIQEMREAVLESSAAPAAAFGERNQTFWLNASKSVPPQFRVLTLEPGQWTDLASALRKSTLSEPQLSGTEAAVLELATESPAVLAAQAAIESQLPALLQAFNAYTAE